MKATSKVTGFSFVSLMLLLTLTTFSQDYKTKYELVRDELYIAYLRLDTARDIQEITLKQLKLSNDDNENYKKDITNLKLNIADKDHEIELLKNQTVKIDLPPFMKWKGFYPGIQVSYQFSDSILTKQTIINGLQFDVTGTIKFEVVGRLDFGIGLVFPLRAEKFGIRTTLEYQLWE